MIAISGKVRTGIRGSHFDAKACGAYGYFVVPHSADVLIPSSEQSDFLLFAVAPFQVVEIQVTPTTDYGIYDVYRSCQNPQPKMRDPSFYRYMTTFIGKNWLDLNHIKFGATIHMEPT